MSHCVFCPFVRYQIWLSSSAVFAYQFPWIIFIKLLLAAAAQAISSSSCCSIQQKKNQWQSISLRTKRPNLCSRIHKSKYTRIALPHFIVSIVNGGESINCLSWIFWFAIITRPNLLLHFMFFFFFITTFQYPTNYQFNTKYIHIFLFFFSKLTTQQKGMVITMRCMTFPECFYADHPFKYFITSTKSNVVLFAGRYAKLD